jgi:hypothetical protein
MAAAEQRKSYQVVKNFKGLNTKANRTAIDEEEFSWLENAQPVGFANLKIVPTTTNTSVTFTNTVLNMFNVNIQLKDYLIAFESDGSAEYVDLSNNTKTTLAAAGTFSTLSGIRVSQWKNQLALIGDPTKGYFTWNGTNLVSIGSVGQIGLVSGGSGYTTTPAVQLSAPNQTGGVQAQATCTVSGGVINAIVLTEAGSGYTSAPTVSFVGGGGSGASAVAALLTFKKGAVGVTINQGGTGYTNAANLVVTISGDGTGASATGILAGGQVVQIVVTNPGNNYTTGTVTITGGGGSNAAATLVPTTNSIVGTESFSGRVWIAQGRTIYYSAAGSATDFISVSAGNVTLADATLHGNIIQLLSANNFLYIFGDDSINVFSDVRVTTTGNTIFTNTNVSASVGTKLPYAIFPYFRSVLFMNQYGVYALVGSTTSKLSDALDGIFQYIDFTSPVTSGQVLLNNILCAAFNFKYTGGQGTSSSSRYIQAIFFEKKWFFTSQGDTINYVNAVPVGGQIYLYGTSGTNLLKFYTDSTSQINSYIQTALMPLGDPIRTKQALKFGIEASNNAGGTLNVTVDSEYGSSPNNALSNSVTWFNNSGVTIGWQNNSSALITWTSGAPYYLYKSDAKQWGKYLGLTLQSQANNMVINTFELEHELRTRF